jgi:hypothetical protein
MSLEGYSTLNAVEDEITDYADSQLASLSAQTGNYVIKFVNSKRAADYEKPNPLYVSTTPALTWGTATYVTPLAFPLSSALYGRIGLVTDYDPAGWRIFDATRPTAQAAYISWIQAQASYFDLLVLTVHSTHANQFLRDRFREQFKIDCVLFHPDQEADLHTDIGRHVWMAVTDWTTDARTGKQTIRPGKSACLSRARFTVLIDEDFALLEEKFDLPIQKAERRIEKITEKIRLHKAMEVAAARSDPTLPAKVIYFYKNKGYLHVYIKP